MGRKHETDDLQKNHRRLVQEKKQKKKKRNQQPPNTSPELLETDENFRNGKKEGMIKKSTGNKKRREKDNNVDVGAALQISTAGEKGENKLSRKKKRKTERKNYGSIGSSDQLDTGNKDSFDKEKDEGATYLSQSETSGNIDTFQGIRETDSVAEIRTRKSKKSGKNKKKNHALPKESGKVPESSGEAVPDNVYHISSGDKDFSKGMKKWIMEYHQSRPGLKTLQQRIDDFIVAHEEKLEQEREEKMARAAEGGWTVVVHHKGRKKTTDSETGITVGSVAQAAVEDKMAKKKSKEVGLDFYRFQRKEAQRNEIMMLQSKFEEDRKRIQQLRAARKFRPY